MIYFLPASLKKAGNKMKEPVINLHTQCFPAKINSGFFPNNPKTATSMPMSDESYKTTGEKTMRSSNKTN
jgi:hypothetical protein